MPATAQLAFDRPTFVARGSAARSPAPRRASPCLHGLLPMWYGAFGLTGAAGGKELSSIGSAGELRRSARAVSRDSRFKMSSGVSEWDREIDGIREPMTEKYCICEELEGKYCAREVLYE